MTLRPTALALLAVAALAIAPAQAEQFLLAGHHQLRIDDQLAPAARLYSSAPGTIPRLVVVAPGLAQPVLLSAGERTAAAVPVPVPPEGADMLEVDPAQAAAQKVPLSVDGTRLRFVFASRRFVIEPREPLLGEVAPDRLLAYMPEYRRNAAAYQPRQGHTRLLETISNPAEIHVFFGIWCPHCERNVPKLLRVLEAVRNPNLKFVFHGLPAGFADDPVARQYKVQSVPAVIVRRGTETLGRIEGEAWERPELALSSLLVE